MKSRILFYYAAIVVSAISSGPLLAGTYSGGTGDPNDPFQIATAQDLIDLGQTEEDYDKHFILTNDIDLSRENFRQAVIAPDMSSYPYGFPATPFEGTFDGNGHVIANLTIDGFGKGYIGLIGNLGPTGVVKNLGLENVNVIGQNYTGGLCGRNDSGTITQCYSTGTVTGEYDIGGLCGVNFGIISECYSNCDVVGGDEQTDGLIGGLCGDNSGTISQCYATGNVTGNCDIGGLCGYNDLGTITQCYASGNVVSREAPFFNDNTGGLCGLNSGDIIQCYATGAVTGNSYVGGLCGYNGYDSGTIRQCYATGTVTGNSSVGGLCGVNGYGKISQCYATGAVTGNSNVGGLCGENYYSTTTDCFWDMETTGQSTSADGWGLTSEQMKRAENFWGWLDGVWTIQEDVAPPRLAWENAEGNPIMTDYPARTYAGSGTAENPFRLTTANDLICLSRRTTDWASHFILMNDIDVNCHTFTQALIACGSSFEGILDGSGHVIHNLTILDLDHNNVGLFYRIGSEGHVKNLGLENVIIMCRDVAAGLCGRNTGTISQCFVTGTVIGQDDIGILCGDNEGIISASSSTGTVIGEDSVGSLCGGNNGTINRCYASGDMTGNWNVGGLCGRNYSGTVDQSYAACTITGEYNVGGLCGENHTGAINQSYATGRVSGNTFVGGLCGQNGRTINQSYATGMVIEKDYGGEFIGGLCGANVGTISQSYATVAVMTVAYSNNTVGGLCGSNSNTTIDCFWDMDSAGQTTSAGGWGLTNEQMKQAESFWGWLDGAWTIQEAVAPPRLAWENAGGDPIMTDYPPRTYTGNGTAEDPYRLATPDDLVSLGYRTIDWDSHFILVNNINLSDVTFRHALIAYNGSFEGVLDGDGYIIHNLRIFKQSQDNMGLFYRIGPGGHVMNLGLENMNITGRDYVGGLCGIIDSGIVSQCFVTGKVSGNNSVGGLCGKNYQGTISVSHSTATIIGENIVGGLCGENYQGTINVSHSTSTITGEDVVGGLCGRNYGTVSVSYAAATINGNNIIGGLCGSNYDTIDQCYATGEITGKDYVGGLCGKNNSFWHNNLKNCYAAGNVEGEGSVGGLCGRNEDTINNCYATGTVVGEYEVGGLCGSNSDTIKQCYATGLVMGNELIGGLCGSNYYGRTTDCFWDIETSGITDSAGGTGLTTTQMQLLGTYINAGWDFLGEEENGTEDIWFMKDGYSYPGFRWRYRSLNDLNEDVVINMKDLNVMASQWGTNRLTDHTILLGNIIVDGLLNEWPDPSQWSLLDQVYEGDPADISDARYALRWDADHSRIYVAAMVTDMDHVFSDGFESGDASDRLEVYCQGSAAGGTDWQGDYDIAQQYHVGAGIGSRDNPMKWTDYEIEYRVRSDGYNDCGLMFRVQDENNYYRFSWNHQVGYSRLVKVQQGVATVLSSRPEGYARSQTYGLRVVACGSEFQIYVDNALWLTGEDMTFQKGTIALYCWGNAPGTYFDDLVVRQVSEDDQSESVVLLEDDFTASDLTDWEVVDQGLEIGPSNWYISNGELIQNSHIYSNPTSPNTVRKEGTFLWYVGPLSESWITWADGQPLSSDVELECAIRKEGDRIVYELAIPVFERYQWQNAVESTLKPGKVIGFDLIALSRTAEGGFGMLAENLMKNKDQDASQFTQYLLLSQEGGCGGPDLDGDCFVNLNDLAILAEYWLWP
ncbi:MAG: hypothetical protein JXA82_00865 [Sedimentisphaerales bacterium]|nr:hypothetical protein [Sedimentisphaerales bacterium]